MDVPEGTTLQLNPEVMTTSSLGDSGMEELEGGTDYLAPSDRHDVLGKTQVCECR